MAGRCDWYLQPIAGYSFSDDNTTPALIPRLFGGRGGENQLSVMDGVFS